MQTLDVCSRITQKLQGRLPSVLVGRPLGTRAHLRPRKIAFMPNDTPTGRDGKPRQDLLEQQRLIHVVYNSSTAIIASEACGPFVVTTRAMDRRNDLRARNYGCLFQYCLSSTRHGTDRPRRVHSRSSPTISYLQRAIGTAGTCLLVRVAREHRTLPRYVLAAGANPSKGKKGQLRRL